MKIAEALKMRRAFVRALAAGLWFIWPILSGLFLLVAVLGILIGMIEGWSLEESLYFAFVTGLTIGYGDFVPSSTLTRGLAVIIGMCGLLLTALVAAIAVKALTAATGDGKH